MTSDFLPLVTLMKGKIHRATVTHVELHYEGSIGIDADLLKASGIFPYERVEIYNITNGQRFATYAIPAPAGSGTIAVYGAAAHLTAVDDLIIICSYIQKTEQQAQTHEPIVVLAGQGNVIQTVNKAVVFEPVG